MVSPRIINAILLNIKTNRPKLVIMCRYKLATYWQNFTEIYLTRVQMLQKSFRGGYFFDSHCICSYCSEFLLLFVLYVLRLRFYAIVLFLCFISFFVCSFLMHCYFQWRLG